MCFEVGNYANIIGSSVHENFPLRINVSRSHSLPQWAIRSCAFSLCHWCLQSSFNAIVMTVFDCALTNINMNAIFALLLLLVALLLPRDNADLLKINYGKLLEQCMEIMNAYIFKCYVCFQIDCVHSPFSHHTHRQN